MTGPTSYWLPNGELIFAYETEDINHPPWIIAKKGNKATRRFTDEKVRTIVRFRPAGSKRYKTEAEARTALHEYAREHGLKPAY